MSARRADGRGSQHFNHDFRPDALIEPDLIATYQAIDTHRHSHDGHLHATVSLNSNDSNPLYCSQTIPTIPVYSNPD